MTQDMFMRVIAAGIFGQLIVVISGWKHIVWRIGKVEDKVEKHNEFGERLARLETRTDTLSRTFAKAD